MYERILLVCTGNICRSPLAEAMLRVQIAAAGRGDAAQVRSAGSKAQLGKRVDDTVLFVARSKPELIESLSNHRSQPIDGTLTWWADLILVMEPQHGQAVVKLDSTARDKVHLLGSGIGKLIPDPYLRHEAVYREVQDLISAAVAAWQPKING
jgi:protein-tyrosine phosphatase